MKRHFLSLLAIVAILAASPSFNSCKPVDTPQEEQPEEDTPDENQEEQPEEPEPDVPFEFAGEYPEGVTWQEMKRDMGDGKTCNLIAVTVDFSKNEKLNFHPIHYTVRKTPTEQFSLYNRDKYGDPLFLTNAGYFAGSTSVSLCIIDGKVKCNSSRAINWPSDEDPQCTVYPVRSALGQMEDGSFEIQWVYCTDVSHATQTAFPSTMGNNEKTKTFLTEAPSADAEGAFTWAPVNAISGGPRLLKDGVDVSTDSYWGECLDAGGTAGLSRQPRTAVGITRDNRLIFVVADGRGMKGSCGMTLKELSALFLELGAVDALNFDGGGSSQIVNGYGQIANWPSDSGSGDTIVERRVVTSMAISLLRNSQVKK